MPIGISRPFHVTGTVPCATRSARLSSGHLMKSLTVIFWALALLFCSFAPLSALHAQSLPPDLESVRVHTIARLSSLYEVDSIAAAAPISIDFVSSGNLAARGWGGLPRFAAGAAVASRSAIVVVPNRTGRYPFGDAAQTLKHELSHVLIYRALGYHPPRWFDEGLAMHVAREWGSEDEWFLAFGLPTIARGESPLARIENDFHEGESDIRRSYALARAFVRELFANDYELQQFVGAARSRRSVEEAFLTRFGMSSEDAFRAWAAARPWWRDVAVAISSERVTWFLALGVFLVAGTLGWWKRKRSYDRLPE